MIRNTPFDQLEIGMEAQLERLCIAEDLIAFAEATGDRNTPQPPSRADDTEAPAPSGWIAALISSVLSTELPGPGTVIVSQTFRFPGSVRAGDQLSAHVRLSEKHADRVAAFETWITGASGERVAEGEAVVIAPDRQMCIDVPGTTGKDVRRHVHFDAVLKRVEGLDPIPTAVVAPEEAHSLGGAILAMQHAIIKPILIGDRDLIEAAADEIGADLTGQEVLHEPNHRKAAAKGVELVLAGQAGALMKGHLHTDELLSQVVKRDGGLRIGRRLSHVFVIDVPGYSRLLFVSDGAINIAPDLETKVDIIQNAIDLARAVGIEQPKVGVLSAVETVNPKIPSTLDAAILSKMVDRGQIRGGLVDGPLAMDNAINLEAARTKGITSLVAGQSDILAVPNIECGNMVTKVLTFAAGAEAGGVVLGARCPIILTSRSDGDTARLASCAIAALSARQTPR